MTQDNDFGMTRVTDSALINQYAAEAMQSDGPDPETAQVATEVLAQFNSATDTSVALPAGLYNPLTGDLTTTAEVRELNGADEEVLQRAKNDSKMLLLMLERAVEKIGDQPATPDLLDSLIIGDRDMLLLAIRQATFGDLAEYHVTCPSCDVQQDVVITLSEDVPVRRHTDADDRYLRVKIKRGVVEMNLPTGSLQKKLLAATDRNVAELNTMMLTDCIERINGEQVFGVQPIRLLGMGDRATLIDALIKAMPGPQFGEVKRTCSACAAEMPLPLNLSDLFRP